MTKRSVASWGNVGEGSWTGRCKERDFKGEWEMYGDHGYVQYPDCGKDIMSIHMSKLKPYTLNMYSLMCVNHNSIKLF